MALLAQFPAGVTGITVHGLHQWDYGQTLDIKAPDLPTVVEVHFAHISMTEAIVRVCSAPNGVASATIPDICLEQTQPVKAWVYFIDETSGRTALTVTLPIKARTRPAPSETIPVEVGDQYTQLIAEVNKVVDDLSSGEIIIRNATNAERAETASLATNAERAETASHATNAEQAATASHAAYAERAETANHAASAGNASADENGVQFDGGYLKAPVDDYDMADRGGTNVFYLPGVGHTVSLRADIGDFWVDMGVVYFPASDATVYLSPIMQMRTVGDGSDRVQCIVLPEAEISTTPGYYQYGQVTIRFTELTVTETDLAVATLYYKVLA